MSYKAKTPRVGTAKEEIKESKDIGNGRLPNGKFAVGNRYGAARRTFAYLLVESVSEDEFKKIIKNLVKIAMNPKQPAQAIRAAELLLNRLCGTPPEAIEDTSTFEEKKKTILARLNHLDN